MTVYELKQFYLENNPDGLFFCHSNMQFFGDTLKNFGVRDGGRVRVFTGEIGEVEVWDLYRRRPVKCGVYGHCAYFRKDNGAVLFGLD
jgi:hypothetical protein